MHQQVAALSSYINTLSYEHSSHSMREDGILETVCFDKFYGLKELKEINTAQRILSGGKKVPVLIVLDEFSNVDKEGREFMATEESTSCSLVEAFVLRTLAQRMLGNFYLRINKPKVPTKFFSKKEEAEKWLLTELSKAATIS